MNIAVREKSGELFQKIQNGGKKKQEKMCIEYRIDKASCIDTSFSGPGIDNIDTASNSAHPYLHIEFCSI